MPLPNPWKTPSTPQSPPSSLRRKTSLRHRNKARLGALVLIAVLTLCALNELRCLHYGCVSRIGFPGSAAPLVAGGVSRGGGATLPEDWKYRLGEQLRINMMEQGIEGMWSGSGTEIKGEEKQKQKQHVEEEEEVEQGKLIEPLTVTPTIDTSVHHEVVSDDSRWIDAPPGPKGPSKQVHDQMEVEKQMYVDGAGAEAPPTQVSVTTPAVKGASEASAAPSPGVQVAAEDLRVAGAEGAKGEKGAKGEVKEAPPKVDKTKEKVDEAIAQKTVPEASAVAVAVKAPSVPSAVPASKDKGVEGFAPPAAVPASKDTAASAVNKAAPKVQHPHGKVAAAPAKQPKQPAHDDIAGGGNDFGSMEMGLLMAGG